MFLRPGPGKKDTRHASNVPKKVCSTRHQCRIDEKQIMPFCRIPSFLVVRVHNAQVRHARIKEERSQSQKCDSYVLVRLVRETTPAHRQGLL